jgi:hypothetical protein
MFGQTNADAPVCFGLPTATATPTPTASRTPTPTTSPTSTPITADCTSSDLTCRLGRGGTTNDTLLSTSGSQGTLTGSSVAGGNLKLVASNVANNFGTVTITAGTSTQQTAVPIFNVSGTYSALGTTLGGVNFDNIEVHNYTLKDGGIGVYSIAGSQGAVNFTTAIDLTNQVSSAAGDLTGVGYNTTITTALAAGVTAPTVSVVQFNGVMLSAGPGSANNLTNLMNFKFDNQGGVSGQVRGLHFETPVQSAGTISAYTGIRVESQDFGAGGQVFLKSAGSTDRAEFGGPVCFGQTGACTTISSAAIHVAAGGITAASIAGNAVLPIGPRFTTTAAVTANDIVIIDVLFDDRVTTVAGADSPLVIGTARATCTAGAVCPIATEGYATVTCNNAIAVGDYITTSAVAGQCKAAAAAPANRSAILGRAMLADAVTPFTTRVLMTHK